ncbi:hypothetical protein AB1Y20_017268 [Prymnesium parvum]|uniref:Rhodanese domain-containing protein n=1 Tax=Prymnesium parvum TaxID=97485 RepID=A0AB34JL49_PRYPA
MMRGGLLLVLTRAPGLRAATLSMPSCSVGGRIGVAGLERAMQLAISREWTHKLPVDEFLAASGVLQPPCARQPPAALQGGTPLGSTRRALLLDVRSPCEYAKGHIPGAVSLPLFSDEERATVGTLYKQHGHETAVRKGLQLVRAKWPALLDGLPRLGDEEQVYVYCFRGGMRSAGMAWLLSQAMPGRVHTLHGGYKRFRNWAIEQWEQPRRVVVLGGKTGSGKTDVLLALRDDLSQQVLDLEGEAHHRGSIFGALGRPPQPSNEHFENLLAVQCAGFSADRPVFVEDESRAVGSCGVPPGLWKLMRGEHSRSLRLDVPHAARVCRLVAEYGVYPPQQLAACVRGLRKRLGGETCERLAAALEADPPALAEVADALLVHYYDGMYNHQMKKRGGHDEVVAAETGDALTNARAVLQRASALSFGDWPTGGA